VLGVSLALTFAGKRHCIMKEFFISFAATKRNKERKVTD
jgi:hypothetical protein